MMKKIITFGLIFFTMTNVSCHAQYLVHNPQEAYKIQDNLNRFLNKPLDSLIAAIKPPFGTAMAEMTANSPASGYFVFTFSTPAESKELLSKGISEVKIQVYLKEPFKWDPDERGVGIERIAWTKEDMKKYGHLTVIVIRVYGGKKYE